VLELPWTFHAGLVTAALLQRISTPPLDHRCRILAVFIIYLVIRPDLSSFEASILASFFALILYREPDSNLLVRVLSPHVNSLSGFVEHCCYANGHLN